MELRLKLAKRLAAFPSRLGSTLMVALLVSTFSVPAFIGAQDKDTEKKETASEQEVDSVDLIDQLKTKLEDALGELSEEYRDAETAEARKQIAQRRRETEKLIVEDVIGATKKRDDDEIQNIRDLTWFIDRQVKGEARTCLIKEVVKNYKDSKGVTGFVRSLGKVKTPTKEIESAIRKVIKTSTNEHVQAESTFTLIDYLEAVKTKARSRASAENYLTSRTKKELDKEVESLLESCIKDFAEVKKGRSTYAKLATKKLQLRNIKIGEIAPDIAGVDLDDVSFKLSDYRGKVVVIDFWGDW